MKKLQFFLLIGLLIFPITIIGQSDQPKVLIIYSLNSEKNAIEALIGQENSDAEVSSILIDNLESTQLDDFDFVVLTSSIDFSISGDEELKLINFATKRNHTLMVFTPFVDQFGGELRDLLGINNINDILPTEDLEYADWTITLDKSIENESSGSSYDYSGKVGDVELHNFATVIASATGSTSTDEDILDVNFPLPVIFNSSNNNAEIITSTLSIVDSGSGILNQIPTFFSILLAQIFNHSFDIHKSNLSNDQLNTSLNPSDSTGTTSVTDPPDENSDNPIPLIDVNFRIEYFLLILLLMGLLFIRKIFAIIRWFGDKLLATGVFVIGAFYNVQDRILDVNDVFLNQSRVELLDYLEHLGGYGSHIRELKSVTNMGTGSLLWHLQVLEDFYLIQKYKVNRNTIFVSSEFIDKFDSDYKKLEMNIQSKYSHTLIDELIKLKGEREISVSRLENLTDISNRTIRRFLNKLNQAEIVIYEQTSPIIFSFENFSLLEKLHRGYELRSSYSFSRSGIDVQSV